MEVESCAPDCLTVDIDIREWGVPGDATVRVKEQKIGKAVGGRRIVYSDGSKAEGVEGMVGGGWYESEETRGGVTVSEKATVSDGEIEGMELELK